MRNRINLCLAFSVALLVASSVAAQRSDLVRLAENFVPKEVGSAQLIDRLLAAKPAPEQLSRAFRPERVLEGVGDPTLDLAQCDCDPPEGHDGPRFPDGWKAESEDGAAVLEAALSRGKIEYLNRSRSFQARDGVENDVSPEEAKEIAIRTAIAFGVPRGEIQFDFVDVQSLIAAARNREGKVEARLRAEVHVRLPRTVSGFPVWDSFYHAAVSSKREIARAHVQWPDFTLVRGLDPASALSRREVVERVVEELSDGTEPGSLKALATAVVYARAVEVQGASFDDDDGSGGEAASPFVPALVVYAIPPDPAEDSGQVVSAGRQFVVPLFEGAPDQGKPVEQG